jgi:hypothetical protein
MKFRHKIKEVTTVTHVFEFEPTLVGDVQADNLMDSPASFIDTLKLETSFARDDIYPQGVQWLHCELHIYGFPATQKGLPDKRSAHGRLLRANRRWSAQTLLGFLDTDGISSIPGVWSEEDAYAKRERRIILRRMGGME